MLKKFTKSVFAASVLGLALGSAAQAAEPLVVYSAIGYDIAMGKAFEKATGIPVKMVDMSTGPLLARVQAEKQNPQWDIAWIDGAAGMRNMAAQGMLAPYAPKVDWNALGRDIQPADHAYVGSAASLACVIVVNKQRVPKADWPHNWGDLTNPKYRGMIGMNNPAVSGPTYPCVAGRMVALGSEKAGKAWFLGLKANGLKTFATNGVTLRALDNGVIKVAIVQNSAGIGRMLKGLPYEVIYPNPVTLLPRTIGISAHTSPQVRAEAEKFIDFLLSKEGQAVAQKGDPTGDSLFYPVVAGVAALPGIPPLSGVTVQTANPAVWGPREGSIDRWFTNHIVH
ncbi:ABC transporter substrate-binding protein [Acidihalobacter ferrooxydans]|uniref:Iron ABC transporter substrate-binding protein n=1 Tax=Acidihalobacter ferrooxydans TaxID=1765967 RepID=A0A1P8UI27_9GAMM|nr:extracellular solute-binding protein [Acidihalobacter ferrooxydans]APZ43411.1 hypothetical protein BW247_10165 [Acidihalobacter ferrooxydans]